MLFADVCLHNNELSDFKENRHVFLTMTKLSTVLMQSAIHHHLASKAEKIPPHNCGESEALFVFSPVQPLINHWQRFTWPLCIISPPDMFFQMLRLLTRRSLRFYKDPWFNKYRSDNSAGKTKTEHLVQDAYIIVFFSSFLKYRTGSARTD